MRVGHDNCKIVLYMNIALTLIIGCKYEYWFNELTYGSKELDELRVYTLCINYDRSIVKIYIRCFDLHSM